MLSTNQLLSRARLGARMPNQSRSRKAYQRCYYARKRLRRLASMKRVPA